MASKGFRKLIDIDGKEYVFSCEKFNNAIVKYQNKLQAKNGYKVSKLSIYEDFSNKLFRHHGNYLSSVVCKHSSVETVYDARSWLYRRGQALRSCTASCRLLRAVCRSERV